MLLHTFVIYPSNLSVHKESRPAMQGGFEHFLSACSLLRFEVTAQPLLKALHNKAFRYAIMLQRFGRHTPLPTLYYYYMQL